MKVIEESKPFICQKCGRGFKTTEYLRKHNMRKNSCAAEYKCSKCHKEFSTASELQRHVDRKTLCAPESVPVITNDNEENKCHMCGNTYSSVSNLNRHKKNCMVAKNPTLLIQLLEEKNKVIQLMEKTQQQQTKITQLESQISGTPQTVINGDVNILPMF